MRKILVAVAVLFGLSFAPVQTSVHADLDGCYQVTLYTNNLASGAISQCVEKNNGTTYPLNEQRGRIKCRLISNLNTWTTRNGAWVGHGYFSTVACASGYIMTERSIQRR